MVAFDNFGPILSQGTSNAGASETSIVHLEQMIGHLLPKDYKEFLKLTNGFECYLDSNRYIVLWSAEQIAEFNEGYLVADFAPALVLIGSDGGGTGYGFDTRTEPMTVCETPFVGMSPEMMHLVADNFSAFLKFLESDNE